MPVAADTAAITVMAAPPGIMAIDGAGVALPIVALQVSDSAAPDGPTITPMYLGTAGEVLPLFPGATIRLSKAWD
jgi:hypothetical protein